MSKHIFIVGGDGFCGWANSLHLSKLGFQVTIIDNLSRRKIDEELGSNSLSPIKSIYERIDTWYNVTGCKINFELMDVAKEYDRFFHLMEEKKPDVIVHFGEQRSAPYSMMNSATSRYTVDNNLNCTHNILCAIARSNQDIHLVHLGTMGVYGYYGTDSCLTPEGYISVNMYGKEMEILHPAYPGSVYHMTKTQDALMFQFYAKNYGIRITDLHQGIVWGTQTEETDLHPSLVNRVDYDETYGTVLNRFIIQAMNNVPMTIYGTGGQTRAFIHIKDSVNCIHLAIQNPPKQGERPKIFNQMVETLNLNNLGQMVKNVLPDSEISYVDNPRKELAENKLNVSNKQFIDLGLTPTYVNEESIHNLVQEFSKYDRFEIRNVLPSSKW